MTRGERHTLEVLSDGKWYRTWYFQSSSGAPTSLLDAGYVKRDKHQVPGATYSAYFYAITDSGRLALEEEMGLESGA